MSRISCEKLKSSTIKVIGAYRTQQGRIEGSKSTTKYGAYEDRSEALNSRKTELLGSSTRKEVKYDTWHVR